MNILITGGAGFVGSSLAIRLKQRYPGYSVACLDNLKRRGSELNLSRLTEAGIRFVHGDIRNPEDLIQAGSIDTIIDASAEPSILAGLGGSPDYVINTNLIGTLNCLRYANEVKASFIFLSTSRVYPIEAIEKIHFEETASRFEIAERQELRGISRKGIAEDFPIEGYRSFYGATKLASEFFIQEYHKFYGLKTVINRCGVIAGPWQMGKADQGVISLWVARHFWKKKLSYIGYGGEGKQVRDVLHIDDLFGLIDFQIHNIEKVNGQLMNAGGGREISASLKELTAICARVTGNSIDISAERENRTADIRIYITDNSRVNDLTHWTPRMTVEEIVNDVFDWMRANESQLKKILD